MSNTEALKLAIGTQDQIREFIGKHGHENTATFLLLEANVALSALRAALAQPAASDTPQDQHSLYVAGWKAGYKHGLWQAQHCAAQPAASGEPPLFRQYVDQQVAKGMAPLYAAFATAQPAPAPAGMVLVPLRMTQAMREVTDQGEWEWPDLLAAANAVTPEQYEQAAQPAPAQPFAPDWVSYRQGVEDGKAQPAPARVPALTDAQVRAAYRQASDFGAHNGHTGWQIWRDAVHWCQIRLGITPEKEAP